MTKIRCPHCGSPAMVRGRQWECGWCGDSGWLSDPKEVEDLSDLERGAFDILEGMRALLGGDEAAKAPTWKLTAYGISHVLLPPERQTGDNLRRVRTFFQRYPVCSGDEVWGAAHGGVAAFDAMFQLSRDSIGTFWNRVLSGQGSLPDGLDQVMNGLCQVETFFSDEDPEELKERLLALLNKHLRS